MSFAFFIGNPHVIEPFKSRTASASQKKLVRALPPLNLLGLVEGSQARQPFRGGLTRWRALTPSRSRLVPNHQDALEHIRSACRPHLAPLRYNVLLSYTHHLSNIYKSFSHPHHFNLSCSTRIYKCLFSTLQVDLKPLLYIANHAN